LVVDLVQVGYKILLEMAVMAVVVVVQTDLKIQMVELEQVGKVMLVGVPHLIRVVLHLMVLVAAAVLEQLVVLG
jgi:hypothetical protein